jgi:glycosyltransferase involved in cell wall biosynthesis
MGMYIAEALASVGKQTYDHWEVIAVDDCGPEDETRECIESFASEYPDHRVELIRHEKNQGVSAARNSAIKAAKGEFIALLDPDDYWMEKHLEILHEKLSSTPQSTVLAFSNVVMSSDSEIPHGIPTYPTLSELENVSQGLALRNFIQPSAALMRRRAVLGVGGFDESPEIQHVEDWDLWLSLLNNGYEITYVDEATAVYRLHLGSASLDESACERWKALHAKQANFLIEHVYAHARMLQRALDEKNAQLAAVRGSRCYRLGQMVMQPVRQVMGKL